MRSYTVLALFAILLCIGTLASMDTYALRDAGSETVLWDSSEAYLFVSTIHRGYKFSKLGYLVAILRAYFNVHAYPNDESYTTLALKITPSATYRYPPQAILLQDFRPGEHVLYASHDRQVWKLGDLSFAEATQQEQKLSADSAPRDFKNLNGWSRRTLGDGPYEDLELELGGKSARFRMIHQSGLLSMAIERSGGKLDKLVTLDERSRKVSRAEYEQFFPK